MKVYNLYVYGKLVAECSTRAEAFGKSIKYLRQGIKSERIVLKEENK